MENIAKKVCSLLKGYGIKAEIGNKCDQPERILRGSWYVTKLIELGYTQCIHIGLSASDGSSLGFLAILNGGKIMSGNNIMIMDAFRAIGDEFLSDDDSVISAINADGWEIYCDDDCDDDACIICPSYDRFQEFLETIF